MSAPSDDVVGAWGGFAWGEGVHGGGLPVVSVEASAATMVGVGTAPRVIPPSGRRTLIPRRDRTIIPS